MSELGHPEPFAVVTGGPLFDPERSCGLRLGSAKSCHSSEANHSHPRSTFGALATARPREPSLGPRPPGLRSGSCPALQHNLALGAPALDQPVGAAKIGGRDRPKALSECCLQR